MIKFLFSFIKAGIHKSGVKSGGTVKAGIFKSNRYKTGALFLKPQRLSDLIFQKSPPPQIQASRALFNQTEATARPSPKIPSSELSQGSALLLLTVSGLVLSGCGGDWTSVLAQHSVKRDSPALVSEPDVDTGGAQAVADQATAPDVEIQSADPREKFAKNEGADPKAETVARTLTDLAAEAERELAKLAKTGLEEAPKAAPQPVLTKVSLSPEEARLFEFAKAAFAEQGIETSPAFDLFVKRSLIPSVFAADKPLWRAIEANPQATEISFTEDRQEKSISLADAKRLVLKKLSAAQIDFFRQNTGNPFAYANLKAADGKTESAVFLRSFEFDKEQLQKEFSYFENPAIVIAGSLPWFDILSLKMVSRTERLLDNLVFLAESVHEKNIPLYIIGHCGPLCSSALAGVAKRVHLDPFGNLAFNRDAAALSATVQKKRMQNEKNMQLMTEEAVKDLDRFAGEWLSAFSELQERGGPKAAQEVFQSIEQKGFSRLADKMRSVAKGRPFNEWTLKNARDLLAGFSPEEISYAHLTAVGATISNRNALRRRNPGIQFPPNPLEQALQIRSIFINLRGALQRLSQTVSALRSDRLNVSSDWDKERERLQRRNGFFDWAHVMTPPPHAIASLLSVGDREYHYIIPETDFLRDELGIKVIAGENTLYRSQFAPASHNREDQVLFLSKTAYENCRSSSAFHAPQSLVYCIDRHADLTNNGRRALP